MAPNLTPGHFKIVSLVSDHHPPTSINRTLPAWQQVYLNGPVTVWNIRKEGPDSYRLSIGGYGSTTVIDDKVNATVYGDQNVDWHATYHKYQDAYTIEPIKDHHKGWTVPLLHDEDLHHAVIEVQPIKSTKSIPPHFSRNQLFRFVRVRKDEGEADAGSA